MAYAHALALDVVDAHRGHVEEKVDEVIREQVHLVYVQDAPVGGREQARLESLPPLRERLLDVQGSREPVRARPDRKLDESHGAGLGRRVLRVGACGALGVRGTGIARERTAGDYPDRGQ